MLMKVIPRTFTELYLHNARQTRADYSVDYVANINADEAPCVAYMYIRCLQDLLGGARAARGSM